jgi:hypothetical protein
VIHVFNKARWNNVVNEGLLYSFIFMVLNAMIITLQSTLVQIDMMLTCKRLATPFLRFTMDRSSPSARKTCSLLPVFQCTKYGEFAKSSNLDVCTTNPSGSGAFLDLICSCSEDSYWQRHILSVSALHIQHNPTKHSASFIICTTTNTFDSVRATLSQCNGKDKLPLPSKS